MASFAVELVSVSEDFATVSSKASRKEITVNLSAKYKELFSIPLLRHDHKVPKGPIIRLCYGRSALWMVTSLKDIFSFKTCTRILQNHSLVISMLIQQQTEKELTFTWVNSKLR
jgi:hypothetical protein